MTDLYANQWKQAPQTQPATQPRFRFVAANSMPIKPVAWLVDQYVEEDALTVMYGPPGKGKSFVALDLSCCIASGIEFHGHAVKPGVSIYVAGEGHNGLARRLHAWAQLNNVVVPQLMFISEAPTDLSSATNAARVAEAVQAIADTTGEAPVLIVIDTMARNFGGDENSATDVGQFIRNVDALRRHWKATVLIVHHSGKDSDRGARGSSALKGAADAEYEVSRNEDDKIIRLTPRKMKDAEEPEPLAFELIGVKVSDSTGKPVSGATLKLIEYSAPPAATTAKLGKQQNAALEVLEQIEREIIERLTEQGRGDKPALIPTDTWKAKCEEAGIPRQRFHDAKHTLIERNFIKIDGPHVIRVRPVRTSLVKPERTDSLTHVKTGQTGQNPDKQRTDAPETVQESSNTHEEF